MAFLPGGEKFKGGKLAGIYLTQFFGPSKPCPVIPWKCLPPLNTPHNAALRQSIYDGDRRTDIRLDLALMYAWAAANYAGHTKKITINAIILAAYGASNIIGPLTFTGQTAPAYIPAKAAIMATLALGVVSTLILRQWYVWENKRRDRRAAAEGLTHVQDTEFLDLTDHENPEFRVSPITKHLYTLIGKNQNANPFLDDHSMPFDFSNQYVQSQYGCYLVIPLKLSGIAPLRKTTRILSRRQSS